MAGAAVILLDGVLFHEPGQAGQHPTVPQLEYRFTRAVVESASQAAQGVLVADDEGFLLPHGLSWRKILAVPSDLNVASSSSSLPDSRWRTVVTPSVDQGPSRTV